MAKAARKSYTAVVNYIAANVRFDSSGITSAATFNIGTLPKGCMIKETRVRVKTAFNGATDLIVGTSADTDHYVEVGDVDDAQLGMSVFDRNAGEVLTAHTPVYAQLTAATTAAEADVVIEYYPFIG